VHLTLGTARRACGNLKQFLVVELVVELVETPSRHYALSFFWLDGFAVPALVVEPVETQRRYPQGKPQTVGRLYTTHISSKIKK